MNCVQHTSMTLRNANISDISSIMRLECSSFIEAIREEEKTFLERIKTFPAGFVLLEEGEKVVGYFSSELWREIPDVRGEGGNELKLNHSAAKSHCDDGKILYISSFALSPSLRGQGLGKKFFREALSFVIEGVKSKKGNKIEELSLIVNEDWISARKIYEGEGFSTVARIEGFFAKYEGSFSDAIFMTKSVKNAIL